jgi:hypothetical protein
MSVGEFRKNTFKSPVLFDKWEGLKFGIHDPSPSSVRCDSPSTKMGEGWDLVLVTLDDLFDFHKP